MPPPPPTQNTTPHSAIRARTSLPHEDVEISQFLDVEVRRSCCVGWWSEQQHQLSLLDLSSLSTLTNCHMKRRTLKPPSTPSSTQTLETWVREWKDVVLSSVGVTVEAGRSEGVHVLPVFVFDVAGSGVWIGCVGLVGCSRGC